MNRTRCPTAYDAPESIYHFRVSGIRWAAARTTLRGVKAVRLVEQLLAS